MPKSVDMDPEDSTDNAHSIHGLSKCTYDQVSCRLFCYSSEEFDSGADSDNTTSISSSKSKKLKCVEKLDEDAADFHRRILEILLKMLSSTKKLMQATCGEPVTHIFVHS